METLNAKIAEMEKSNKKLQQDAKEATTKAEAARKELAESKNNAIAALEEKTKALNEKVASVKRAEEAEKKVAELEKTVATIASLKEKIASLEEEKKNMASAKKEKKVDTNTELLQELRKNNEEVLAQLNEERAAHKKDVADIRKKLGDDSAIVAYLNRMSRMLQGEDILKAENEKGCEVDNRECPKCHTGLTKALSTQVRDWAKA